MDLRMKCKQKYQGDPWQRMSTAEKKLKEGGRPAFGRPASLPQFLFCRGHPLPFPLHFCLHFIWRSMVNHCYFFNANANANGNANSNANANANAMVMFGNFLSFFVIVCNC